jgi:hypothetical protein
LVHAGKMIRGSFVAAARKRRHPDALRRGLLQDDRVEPVTQRHPRTARRFLRGLLRVLSNSFDVPRKAKFHAHTHVRGGDESDRLSWNRRALTAGGYGARFFVHTQLFAGHGKQPVNVLRFWRPRPPDGSRPRLSSDSNIFWAEHLSATAPGDCKPKVHASRAGNM